MNMYSESPANWVVSHTYKYVKTAYDILSIQAFKRYMAPNQLQMREGIWHCMKYARNVLTNFWGWGQEDNNQVSEQVTWPGSPAHLAFEEMYGSTSTADNNQWQYVNGWQWMAMTMNLFSNLNLHSFTIYILYINNYSFVQIGGPM